MLGVDASIWTRPVFQTHFDPLGRGIVGAAHALRYAGYLDLRSQPTACVSKSLRHVDIDRARTKARVLCDFVDILRSPLVLAWLASEYACDHHTVRLRWLCESKGKLVPGILDMPYGSIGLVSVAVGACQ